MVDEEIAFAGVPPSEIGINIQLLSDGGVEAESQLPRPFHRIPPSSSEVGMNFQMTGLAGDEAEAEAPSEETTGLNIAVAAGEGAGRDTSLPWPVHSWVTPPSCFGAQFVAHLLEFQAYLDAAADLRFLSDLGFLRTPSSASGLMLNTFGVNGNGRESCLLPPETGMMFNPCSISAGGHPPPAEFQMLPEGGDGANGDPRLPPPETGMMFNGFSISGGGPPPPAEFPVLLEGGDGANGDPPPPFPLPANRVMHHCAYASISSILGISIHVLADMMEPTTENKKLIRVSMASLIGNVAVNTWLNLHGVNLPNDDWKNIIFKIVFVFTRTLTLYASFSTLAADWFTFPGIALCGALAVGVGHSDGLNKLCKKLIATVKNATQKIQELIA